MAFKTETSIVRYYFFDYWIHLHMLFFSEIFNVFSLAWYSTLKVQPLKSEPLVNAAIHTDMKTKYNCSGC